MTTTKTVYLFDGPDGEFTRTYEAHISPCEPGVFHAPQHSTDDPLPAGMTGGQRAVRRLADGITVPNNGTDGSWLLKDEHRGETWYDKVTGAPAVIESLDIPSNLAATKPVSILRAEVWEKIKAKRDQLRFDGGVKVGVHWFKSTSVATSEYNTLLQLSAGIPDTTVLRAGWRTMDGSTVDMTPALAKQILTAGVAQVAAIDDVAQAHRAAMEAAADPAVYNFSANWPATFPQP